MSITFAVIWRPCLPASPRDLDQRVAGDQDVLEDFAVGILSGSCRGR
jgi:hypothetical protein